MLNLNAKAADATNALKQTIATVSKGDGSTSSSGLSKVPNPFSKTDRWVATLLALLDR